MADARLPATRAWWTPPRASSRTLATQRGLDATLVAAIEDGRDLIVPDRHRAAALRLAWARRQLAAGHKVWTTPSIHTWDAWLARQWRDAVQRGAAPPAQLLEASQERALWESVLAGLAGEDEDETTLVQHAGAMMQAAARAVQSRIDPARLAQGREESLLADALGSVRRECRARALLSLRLADVGQLGFLSTVRAPRIIGERQLTALQSELAARFWPGETLLLAAEQSTATTAQLRHAPDLEGEIAAVATWCRAHIERDPGARLLVLSACMEPGLSIQAAMLWRELAGDAAISDAGMARWLAVEGGEPLLHQALAADALSALDIAAASEIDVATLQILLRSPYCGISTEVARLRLVAWLEEQGLARWPRAALVEALRGVAAREAAAAPLADWLDAAQATLRTSPRAGATEWARRFTAVLDAAGHARSAPLDADGQPGIAHSAPLDSRDQQRLGRWNELLDEFAGLDAVLPPLGLQAALSRVRRLASQARHQAASADAAITLSAQLADPVVGYDGIWVLGLTENRWPAAPRPDAWVPLLEQRRAQWPEAGVTQRREQALWALDCWRARGAELVLSHPLREGDIEHRPTSLAGADATWLECEVPAHSWQPHPAEHIPDAQLSPVQLQGESPLLKGGSSLLNTQLACPFRAQAQWRMGAQPPARLSQGIPASLRGRLLHLLLQHLWAQLKDQRGLLSLDEAAQVQLISRCWDQAVRETQQARWLAPQVFERERARALRTVAKVLELERLRPDFTVEHSEAATTWQGAGARVSLRIDRIDRVGTEALLIDYKSGSTRPVQLHNDVLQPLQLALYAAALAQQGRAVNAAALLDLNPGEPKFLGVGGNEGILPLGLRQVDDWARAGDSWQQQLVALMQQHLSGDATLTRDPAACKACHLPALCRKTGEEVEDDDMAVPE